MSASAWWPVDVPASRWFTDDERAESSRYHGPIQRAAVVRSVGQVVALVAVWRGVDQTSVGPSVAVALVVAAIALPRLAVDSWHEFVHEPRFGGRPVRGDAFVATVLGRLALEGVLTGLGAVILIRSGDDIDPWVAGVLAATAAASIPVISARLGPRVVLALHQAVEVDPAHPAQGAVGDAARHFGLARPRLVVLDDTIFSGANAYVVGRRSSPVVAVSRRLLDGPGELLAHVVSHEMAHVARRHVVWTAAVAAVGVAVTAFVAVFVTLRWESGAARLPLLVIVAAGAAAPFRLLSAWTSRAHERRADLLALRVAPVGPEMVVQLHLSDRPLLEPNLVAGLLASHPAPAERAESAARQVASPLRT